MAQDTPSPAAPASSPDDGIPGEALAGLLAALGIGAVGYAAFRSRRRRTAPDEAYLADETLADRSLAAEPVHDEVAPPRTAPVFGTPRQAQKTEWRYGLAPIRAEDAETQVMEREPMAADDRTAVLDRMVDAAPDEANPFTSRKARRKRARLLLQQREAEAQRSAPFDWRSYSPSTKPSTPAHTPLVTA